jgi:Protein of unknown function (DUF2778)
MTVATAWPYDSGAFDRELGWANALPQRLFGGAALTCIAAACAWTICANIGASGNPDQVAARADRLAFAAGRGDKLAVIRLPQLTAADRDTAAFDSRFAAAFPSATAPAAYTLASAAPSDVPLPLHAPRLARSAAPPRIAESGWRPQPDAAQADNRTLFEKIFGGPSTTPSIFTKLFGSPQEKVAMAYAAPEAGGAAVGVASPLYDRQTAVYDISAHAVYLPDGTVLEAHSGYGSRLDDPGSAAIRDRGVTPPDIYDLKPREAVFHGVHALRLIPVDESKVYGRSGLLAHTYMLGPNGQSNGCVSFKDYDAFLEAYDKGEITRLAVVSRVD